MDIETVNALANITQIPIVVGILWWVLKQNEEHRKFMERIIDKITNSKKDYDT